MVTSKRIAESARRYKTFGQFLHNLYPGMKNSKINYPISGYSPVT